MNTSRTIARLSEPIGDNRIPPNSLVYMQERTKLKLFDLIHERLSASGLSQADLARRLGKGTDQVCRLLGAPGNWTLETVSNLLFAIEGGFLKPEVIYPFREARRNDTIPHYLEKDIPTKAFTTVPSVVNKSTITTANTVVMEIAR